MAVLYPAALFCVDKYYPDILKNIFHSGEKSTKFPVRLMPNCAVVNDWLQVGRQV